MAKVSNRSPVDRTYTEYCPFTGNEQTITIQYRAVAILGSSYVNYRATSFSCPNDSECNVSCPIYENHATFRK